MTKEKFTVEAGLHTLIHLLGILGLIWAAIALPLGLSILVAIIEVLQMKYFGSCILTVYAHKRGYMRGKTYWQYVSYRLGIKNYKLADKIISGIITLIILGSIILRLIVQLKTAIFSV